MSTTWTLEAGLMWATLPDGRCLPTWRVDVTFHFMVDLLNLNPSLSRVLLDAWLGKA